MKTAFTFGALVLVLVNCESVVRGANISDFIDFSLRAANNTLQMPGRLFVPPEAAAGSPRPLILFLHGAGESGADNVTQVNGNIDNLLDEAKRRGAFLYAPQTNSGWRTPTETTRIVTMLDRALAEYHVDRQRQYATGLSMGGGGVWNMINRLDGRFAAAVPICGVAPSSDFRPANLLDESIWAFHARDDSTVTVGTTRNLVNRLLGAAGETTPTYPPLTDRTTLFGFDSQSLDLHYTELPTGGHVVWPFVYAHQPMYDWMFAHVATVPEPTAWLMLCIGYLCFAVRRRKSAFQDRV